MTGNGGNVSWDPSRPDGLPRRWVDGEHARQLFGSSPVMAWTKACGERSTGSSNQLS